MTTPLKASDFSRPRHPLPAPACLARGGRPEACRPILPAPPRMFSSPRAAFPFCLPACPRPSGVLAHRSPFRPVSRFGLLLHRMTIPEGIGCLCTGDVPAQGLPSSPHPDGFTKQAFTERRRNKPCLLIAPATLHYFMPSRRPSNRWRTDTVSRRPTFSGSPSRRRRKPFCATATDRFAKRWPPLRPRRAAVRTLPRTPPAHAKRSRIRGWYPRPFSFCRSLRVITSPAPKWPFRLHRRGAGRF